MYLRKFLNSQRLLISNRKNFSILDTFTKNTVAYRLGKYDPTKEIESHNPKLLKTEDKLEIHTSVLNNGVTVITESNPYPSNVHMGILLSVGSRDETSDTSGACLALKNTYLKTLKHTNETLNYGMTQMAGADTTMEYDEETIFYHTYAFDYDVTDMFRMISDMAFEPRSIMNANVAKDKNRNFFQLQHHLSHYNPFASNPQNLLTTAYGYNTLGMPKFGFESNVENIDAKMLQEFQLSNITPNRVIVIASGVKKHQEFVDLVKYHLSALHPVRETGYSRRQSEYIGGEYRVFTETPETNIILGYESVHWKHRLMPAFAVMHTLFGSAQGFSVGGPGKGMLNRAYNHILRKKYYVSNCECINLHFSDSGIFAFNFTGDSAHSKEILHDIIETFNGFRTNIDEVELNRAKNILKRTILTNLSNQGDRMEESAKSYNTFGRVMNYDYLKLIDEVTSKDINEATELLFDKKPTLVVTGNAVNLVPSVSDIQQKLK